MSFLTSRGNYSIPKEFRSVTSTEMLWNFAFLTTSLVNSFGLYLIMFRSPSRMRAMRNATLFHHICSLSLDFFLSFLLRAQFFLPILGGELCGVLHYMGMYTSLISFTFLVLLCVIAAVNVVMAKHQLLLQPGSFFKMRACTYNWTTILYHSLTGCPVLIMLCLSYEPMEITRKEVIKLYPFARSLIMSPSFMLIRWENPLIRGFFTFVLLYIFIYAVMCAILIFHCIYTINSRNSSKITKGMELRLLRILIIQISTPFALMGIPITGYIFICMMEIFYVQDLTNLFYFVCSLHGAAGTVVRITMNDSYSKEVKRLFHFIPLRTTEPPKPKLFAIRLVTPIPSPSIQNRTTRTFTYS